jgi:hypothetical protein
METRNFVNRVADSLKQNDTLEFHKIVNSRLQELLDIKLSQLKESMADPEMEAVTKIQVAAKGYGAGDSMYSNGVLIVTLRSKQAALEFSDWLEKCDSVDSYGMEIVHHEPLEGYSEKGEYDIESITDDRDFDFEFTIYLNPDLIVYDAYEVDDKDFDDDSDDGDEGDQDLGESVKRIDEVVRKIKVDATGAKRIKMQCARGFKWNPSANTCEKIGGAELAIMRKATREALLTKKSEGSAFRLRMVRRMKKAMRFRKQLGLKV